MEIENLIKLIETVSASELTGMKYEENGMKLHLTKKKEQIQVVAASGTNMYSSEDGASVMSPAPQAAGNMMNSPSGTKEAKAGGTLENGDRIPEGKIVESPLVGTFYAAPSEDAAPFVTVGDTVKKGQTLAIIEAMKLMNEIESEYDGTVAEILVENGKPVEYGQPLFRIR